MLAVQGPRAREIVQALADGRCPRASRVGERRLAGREALVCGTGYTGEDGVELLLAGADAPARLGRAAAPPAPRPPGSAARDTLRLEVCFHLYGNDLMESRGPIEAGLGWCCKEDTGFIGSEAVARRPRGRAGREARPVHASTAPASPRQGNPVVGGGEVDERARCRRGSSVGIGMAYVPADARRAGTALEIDVRGKRRDAVVAEKPLYRT